MMVVCASVIVDGPMRIQMAIIHFKGGHYRISGTKSPTLSWCRAEENRRGLTEMGKLAGGCFTSEEWNCLCAVTERNDSSVSLMVK